ncbi:MAG: helix-turn-helix domain-containing protein, partial [Polyangiales bacterium]
MPPKTEDRAKARERVATRRKEILKAAYQVFASKGYRDTTVADIAQQLAIGHGTFYRYFENKNDVFEQVLMTGLMRVAQSISSEDASASDTLEGYRAQVRRIGERMLDLLENDPALPRLLFYEAMGISPELDEKIQRMWELSGTFTEAYLHNGKKRGFLRADLDVPLTALAVNAMIFEAGRRVLRSADRVEAR